MAIVIHRPEEIEGLRRAGRVAAATLREVCRRVRPGITTAQIDRWIREDTAARGATPSQLGYRGFPAAVCVSPNEVVCHGIPSPRVRLERGDIVNIDVTSCFQGFHGDCSAMVVLGPVSPEVEALVRACEASRDAGIAAVRPGARLGDIGAAVEAEARAHGFEVVREYGGHGIGRMMHMPPQVLHHGPPGRGARLRPGMAITIEPMLTVGSPRLVHASDGWTVRTADGSPSAQCEHTILVTEEGAEILTLPPD